MTGMLHTGGLHTQRPSRVLLMIHGHWIMSLLFASVTLMSRIHAQETNSQLQTQQSSSSVTDSSDNAATKEWHRLLETAQPASIASTADQFVGFVRGRLNVHAPSWWRDILASGYLDAGTTTFSLNKALTRAVRKWKKSGELRFNGCEQVTLTDTHMLIADKDRMIRIPRDLFNQTEERLGGWSTNHFNAIAVELTDKDVFIVCGCQWDHLGVGQELICVNLQTLERRWAAPLIDRLLSAGYTGAYSGTFTQIRANAKTVTVWGAHDESLSFQVFAVEDGDPMCQFCTSTEVP